MCKHLVVLGLFVSILTGCGSPASTDSKPPIHPCAWLAGTWRAVDERDGRTIVTTEHWLDFTRFGSLAVSRTMIEDDEVFFEFLRIRTSRSATEYIAQPRGRSPGVAFKLVELGDQRAVFANPEHDFPQRIIYQREGDELRARIEGVQNGAQRVERWVYRRK